MAAAFRDDRPGPRGVGAGERARLPSVVRRVSLPLVRPALYASVLLVAIRALEAFEMPALLGIPGGVWVFTSRIWRELNAYPADLGAGGRLRRLAVDRCHRVRRVPALPSLARAAGATETVTGRGGVRPQSRPPRPVALAGAAGRVCAYSPSPSSCRCSCSSTRRPSRSTRRRRSATLVEHDSLDNYAAACSPRRTRSRSRSEHGRPRRRHRDYRRRARGGRRVARRAHARARPMARRRARVRTHRDSGPRARPRAARRLPSGAHLRSTGRCGSSCIAYVTAEMPSGMRFAVGVDASGRRRARGVGACERRQLVANLPPRPPAVASSRSRWQAGSTCSWRLRAAAVQLRILLYSPGNEVLSIRIWDQYQAGPVHGARRAGHHDDRSCSVRLIAVAYKLGGDAGSPAAVSDGRR